MDWSNERYVRLYTRDTTTWKLMDWRARTVLMHLVRKVDRAGVLDVGHDGVLGLAAVVELPLDIVEAGITQLTAARGGMPTVVDTGTAYVLPNFIEAQEAPASDPQRKRESRARRRDRSLAASRGLLLTDGSDRDGHETGRDQDENTDEVTPIRSDPSLAEPDPIPARAIPASTEHGVRPSTETRAAVRDRLRTEVDAARARAGIARNVRVTPLLAFDRGIDTDLTDHLSKAPTLAALEKLEHLARHAIAMAELEVTHGGKSFEWFTGAIFSGGNFSRLAGMTAEDARRPRAGPNSSAARATSQPMIRPKFEDEPPQDEPPS